MCALEQTVQTPVAFLVSGELAVLKGEVEMQPSEGSRGKTASGWSKNRYTTGKEMAKLTQPEARQLNFPTLASRSHWLVVILKDKVSRCWQVSQLVKKDGSRSLMAAFICKIFVSVGRDRKLAHM